MARTVTEVDIDLRAIETRVTGRERVADVHDHRIGAIEKMVQEVGDAQKGTVAELTAFRRETEREIALLKHQCEELKRDRDKWEQRFWLFVIPLSVMVLGALILAAIGLKKP